MRIVFVTPYFYPDRHYGGTPRAAFELARALVARGHDVRVLTTGDSAHTKDVDGITVRYYQNVSASLAYRQRLFMPMQFRGELEEQLKQCDLVHIHEFRSILTINAASAAHRMGLPYVLSPHGGLPHLGKRFAKRIFDLFWGRSILARAAAVLILSEKEKADAVSFGVDLARIRHLPNAIDEVQYASLPQRGLFRQRWNIPPGKIVLFLGRLNRIKGIDLLVEACRELQGVQLVLAGPNEGETATDVLMTGFLDHDAKLEALVDSDVVVLPSRSEASPVVLFEALLCNRPVVVSSACELPMAAPEKHGVLQFRSLDVPDLRQKLLFALSQPHLSDNATVGRDFVRREYSPQAVARRAEAIYEEVLFRKRKSSMA